LRNEQENGLEKKRKRSVEREKESKRVYGGERDSLMKRETFV
jgi:hypothetical protein